MKQHAGFKARQDAARAFRRKTTKFSRTCTTGSGPRCITTTSTKHSYTRCRIISTIFKSSTSQAQVAAGLGTTALGQLGTAASTFGGVGTGAQSFQQGVQDFMSPYQSQVIDASLAEFDRNTQIQEQQIRDQQAKLGALGSGRAGVQLAEFGTGAARERALLQAGLLQQGFGQAQAARQQDIQNRFNLGQHNKVLLEQLKV